MGHGSSARLVVLSGPSAGEVIDVAARATIGRRPENRLVLEDTHMSRFHAVIERRGARWVIEDLSGRGRTTVDGRLVDGTLELEDHARITLGRTTLRFRLSADEGIGATTGNMPCIVAHGATPLPMLEPADRDLRVVPVERGVVDSEDLEAEDLVQLRRSGTHLKALLTAQSVISDELDVHRLLERILDAVFETFDAHRAVVLTAEGKTLRVRAARYGKNQPPDEEPTVSSTIAYRAFLERVGVLTLDAGLDTRFESPRSIIDQDIRSVMCAPLLHRDEALGVLYLDTIGVLSSFTDGDLRLLNAIAGAAAGALENAKLVAQLKDTAVDTIFRLAMAAEHRDQETGYHIHRMSEYASVIARALGLGAAAAETIRITAPMHDVGKIGIPDAILKKPGRLSTEEFAVMKQHTVKGGEILAGAQSELLQVAQRIALTHHERFDGLGYPYGLREDGIPVEGRVVAVADVFDAVVSSRCYKPAYGLEQGIEALESGRGTQFDPEVVDAFFLVQDELLEIRARYAALEAEDAPPPRRLELLLRPSGP